MGVQRSSGNGHEHETGHSGTADADLDAASYTESVIHGVDNVPLQELARQAALAREWARRLVLRPIPDVREPDDLAARIRRTWAALELLARGEVEAARRLLPPSR